MCRVIRICRDNVGYNTGNNRWMHCNSKVQSKSRGGYNQIQYESRIQHTKISSTWTWKMWANPKASGRGKPRNCHKYWFPDKIKESFLLLFAIRAEWRKFWKISKFVEIFWSRSLSKIDFFHNFVLHISGISASSPKVYVYTLGW